MDTCNENVFKSYTLVCKSHAFLHHLISCVFQCAVVLVKHHPESEQSHDESVTQVPKHDSKQEGECDECERSCKTMQKGEKIPLRKWNIFTWYTKTNTNFQMADKSEVNYNCGIFTSCCPRKKTNEYIYIHIHMYTHILGMSRSDPCQYSIFYWISDRPICVQNPPSDRLLFLIFVLPGNSIEVKNLFSQGKSLNISITSYIYSSQCINKRHISALC